MLQNVSEVFTKVIDRFVNVNIMIHQAVLAKDA